MAPVGREAPSVLGLDERAAVDGLIGGQPHAPVGPRRFRIPLVEEIEVVDADGARKAQAEFGSRFSSCAAGASSM